MADWLTDKDESVFVRLCGSWRERGGMGNIMKERHFRYGNLGWSGLKGERGGRLAWNGNGGGV